MWDIRQKATNEQTRKTKTHRHRQQYGGYKGSGLWGLVNVKRGQIYGDRRRFDFGW